MNKFSPKAIIDLSMPFWMAQRDAELMNLYRSILKRDPKNKAAIGELIILEGRSGNRRQAFEKVNKMIAIHPKKVDGYLLRGLLYLQRANTLKNAAQDFRRALMIEDELTRKIDLNVEGKHIRISVPPGKGKVLQESLAEVFGVVPSKSHDFTELLLSLAEQDYKGFYTKLELLRPEFTKRGIDHALISLARPLLQNEWGLKQEAINELSKTLQSYPDSPILHECCGYMRLERGDFEEAVEDFSFVLSSHIIATTRQEVYHARATSHLRLGHLGEALGDFDNAISIDKAFQEAYWLRAFCKFGLDDTVGAIKDLNILVDELKMRASPVLAFRGFLYVMNGESEKARPDIRRALRLEPKSGFARCSLGVYYLDRKQIDCAEIQLKKALRLDPCNQWVIAWGNLGMAIAKYQTGNVDEAHRHVYRLSIIGIQQERLNQILEKTGENLTKLHENPIVPLVKTIDPTNEELPILQIDIKANTILIGDTKINLTQMEFAHYCVFAKMAKDENAPFGPLGNELDSTFLREVLTFHRSAFPKADGYRMGLEGKLKRNKPAESVQTFRGHISRINKAINTARLPNRVRDSFRISPDGPKGARKYFISAPVEKIVIIR